MQIKADKKMGSCGCGRSPTGDCVGWHGLTEQMYQHKKMLWLEEQFKQDNIISNNNQQGNDEQD